MRTIAQTLRYVDEVLSSFQDNASGLIDAVHMRDFAASFANGGGFLETTTDVTIPVVSGSPVAINPLLLGVTTLGTAWQFDGNNFLFPDYENALPATVIPPGYSKFAILRAVLSVTKTGGATDNYIFRWTKNGSPFGIAHDVVYTGAGTRMVNLPEAMVQDISISTDTYGVSIEGVGTGADVVIESMSMTVTDNVLNTAP